MRKDVDCGIIDLNKIFAPGSSLPDPVEYQYYLNLLKYNTVLITDELDSTAIERYVLPIEQMANAPTEDVPAVNIIINSPGGDVDSGLAVCDAICRIKNKPVNIRCIGDALSMGIYILMCNNKTGNIHKSCNRFATGLIHAGNMAISGETNSVDDTNAYYKQVNKRIDEYVIENTKIDAKYLAKCRRKQQWLTAKDMLDLGIVDEIEE